MWSSDPRVLPALAAASLLTACPGPIDRDPFDCTIGLWTEDEPFVPLAADGTTAAEMVFGFQGFLWVDTAIQADEDGPDLADVALSIDIDGFAPFGTSVPGVEFAAHGDGFRSGPVQVRLDNDEGASRYEGLAAEVAMRVRGEREEGVCTAAFTLVDEDPCIHTDDEPDCPDDDDSGEID